MTQPEDAATVVSVLMIWVVATLFMTLVLLFFLLLVKRYYDSNPIFRSSFVSFVFDSDDEEEEEEEDDDEDIVTSRGLDPSVIRALPVTIFHPEDFNEGLECAVCLCELLDGDKARVLPKCNHGFHLECIDVWFHSNNTCPLCRSLVCSDPDPAGTHVVQVPPASEVDGDGSSPESLYFPANLLVWGSRDQVSAGFSSSAGSSSGRRKGVLVIEIPRRPVGGYQSLSSSLSSSRLAEEEIKSPLSSRLRSLTRILNLSRGMGGPSCSPKYHDIEQGIVGAAV